MAHYNVSATVAAADLTAILNAIETINSKLPFLINLTYEERQALFKMGAKTVDFVQDASEVVKAFPTVLPLSFNTAEYFKDVELIKTLTTIKVRLDALQEKVDDTLVEVSSEALAASLEVYALVQSQSQRMPGLKSSAEKLEARFKRKRTFTKFPPDAKPSEN